MLYVYYATFNVFCIDTPDPPFVVLNFSSTGRAKIFEPLLIDDLRHSERIGDDTWSIANKGKALKRDYKALVTKVCLHTTLNHFETPLPSTVDTEAPADAF